MPDRIKVSTEALNAQAQAIESVVGNLKNQFEQVKNTLDGSRSYWTGAAADKHRQLYSSIETDVSGITERWKKHIDSLRKIAGVYQQTESTAASESSELPSDVLS